MFFRERENVMQNRGWILLKLRTPNQAKRLKLESLQGMFGKAVAGGIQMVLNAKVHKPGEIHQLTYPQSRQAGLPSAYARLVVNEVTALERKSHRQGYRMLEMRGGLGLPANCYRLVVKHDRWSIRMSVGERGDLLWLPLHVPKKLAHRLEQVRGDARLFQRDGHWYAALPIQMPTGSVPAIGATAADCVGVDLGLVRLVTAYSHGRVLIIRGKHLTQYRKRLIDHRRKAVQNQKEMLAARLKQKERRWVGTINHTIANQLVRLAARRPGSVIALEKLDGLLYHQHRSWRFSKMRRGWNYRQLVDLIQYKASENGIRVVFVDPRKTSITCPRCNLASEENTSPNGRFYCKGCGYTSISDIVAARNIAAREEPE